MSAAWQTVHVRVNDAATGQPTPVRLRITGGEGYYYPPLGRLAEFATGRNQDVGGNLLLGRKQHAYIDGTCAVPLPPGPLHVEISKGPQYRPLRQDILLNPGQLALRFTLERWTNLREEGWYSGDCRTFFLPPHAALLEGAGEDLDVVNLLATEVTHDNIRSYPNLLAFSGQSPVFDRREPLVVVNTFNTHPLLGSLALLNCHRVVYPLSFGGRDGWDTWSLADWCDQCHRKGGLVVWSRSGREGPDFVFGEPLADLILGKIDAFEMDFYEDSPFDRLPDWYALLNCGLRVPLVGSSGKDSNGIALDAMRTYAKLGWEERFTYKSWIEAIRAGRTFISNGPRLLFMAGDQDPGATLKLPDGNRSIRVRAEARSLVPFDRLEILVNGAVAMTAAPAGNVPTAALDAELTLPASGWLAARCVGDTTLPQRPAPQRIFAHSSPIYVEIEGRPFAPVEPARARLLQDIDRMLEWSGTEREHLANILAEARATLMKKDTTV